MAQMITKERRNLRTEELFAEAKRYLIGGVNSPVRSFRTVGGEPVFIKSAKGSRIYSEDGREFIDYCMAFGPLILGHSHPAVVDALEETLKNGAVFGAPTKGEMELARTISEAIPSIERIRFTNSGTEAVMTAIRLARAYTKRNKVIKFKEGYHGHADYLLDCPGVPEDFKKDTLIAPYNYLEKAAELTRENKDIAAIIVEPVAANSGIILPREGFLEGLRDVANRHGIVLIFDEVITGFRISYGAAQNFFGVTPDLTCLGKIIGGGLPAGAVGGRGDLMKLLAPEGPVYQAGTFSGNPLTTNAGLVTLKILSKERPYDKLEIRTREFCEGIERWTKRYRVKLKPSFIASMFSISCDAELFKEIYHKLLEAGIYLSPSSLETNFISTAHTAGDIEKTLESVKKTLSSL